MAQRRTLFYDGETALWRDRIQGIVRGTLAEAAAAFEDSEAVVIVPGEEILLTRVLLPPIRQARRRLAAARFALEDRLAGRIDNLHFAPGAPAGAGAETPVAVVDAAHMQHWCDVFEAAGLDVARILPDALALPAPESDAWQIALFQDRVLARTGPVDGFACARDLWPMLAGALEAPANIHIHAISRDAIGALQAFGDAEAQPTLTPHTHASHDALLGLLLDNAETGRTAINLRQGDFARKSKFESRWRPFVLTGALAASWLVIAIAGRAIETWQLDHRIDALHQQTLAAFHSAFPNVQTINDLQSQAQQGLESLRGSSNAGGLFQLLQATAAVTGATDSLQVQAMQYHNGELDLSINGKNVQSVEALRSGFAKQSGVTLNVQSTDASSAGVQIRASLSQASSS